MAAGKNITAVNNRRFMDALSFRAQGSGLRAQGL
jgi:hypothetical protein